MWSRSYSVFVSGLTARHIWEVWTDVNQWDQWQDDIEFAKLDGEFQEGQNISFRPKGGPTVKLELVEVIQDAVFVDLTRFPFAKMLDHHALVQRADGVEVTTTISVTGPLSFLWRKIVAENIVKGLEQQTAKLIERCHHV